MEPQLTLGKGLKFGLFLLSDLGFPVDEAAPTPNKEGTSLVDVQRIPYKEATWDKIRDIVVTQGKPLVLTDTLRALPGFDEKDWNFDWLRKSEFGSQKFKPRNVETLKDEPEMTVRDYVDWIFKKQRKILYGKDIVAPLSWQNYLTQALKPELIWKSYGDILGDLEQPLQSESIMIYIGGESSRTPGHEDICGTIGHNIMVASSDYSHALWHIVGSADIEKARAWWPEHGTKKRLDEDNNFVPRRELQRAPFTVYEVVQRTGDFVIVPPMAAHQVCNRGQTVKFAWNRLPSCLAEKAVKEALPYFHRTKKPEVYRIRAAVMSALQRRSELVNKRAQKAQMQRALEDLVTLIPLYIHILSEEHLPESFRSRFELRLLPQPTEAEKTLHSSSSSMKTRDKKAKNEIAMPHERICNICRADIFCRSIQFISATRPIKLQPSTLEIADDPHVSERIEKERTNLFLRLGVNAVAVNPNDYDVCIHCAADIDHWPHRARALVTGVRVLEDVSREQLYAVLRNAVAAVHNAAKQVRGRVPDDPLYRMPDVTTLCEPEQSVLSQGLTDLTTLPARMTCHHCQEEFDSQNISICNECFRRWCSACPTHHPASEFAVRPKKPELQLQSVPPIVKPFFECPICEKNCFCFDYEEDPADLVPLVQITGGKYGGVGGDAMVAEEVKNKKRPSSDLDINSEEDAPKSPHLPSSVQPNMLT